MMQPYLLVPALVEALDAVRPERRRETARRGGWQRVNAFVAALIAPAITMP